MTAVVHVIENAGQHAQALQRLEALIIADREEDTALMDSLALLIEDYEEKAFPIPEASPVEVILFRMEQRQLTKAELSRRTNIGRGRITEFLQGKRTLSIGAMRAFHTELQIPLEVLFGAQSQADERQTQVR